METLTIIIFQHELTQSEHIKVLLESSGYAVTWTNLSQKETLTIINQNSIPCSILDIQKNRNKEEKEVEGLSKPIDQGDIQSRNSTRFLKVNDQENDLILPEILDNGFRKYESSQIVDSIKPSNSRKGAIKKSIPPSQSFVFEDSFFVRSNSALVKLKFEDIIYLEADANYTQVLTKEKTYIIRASLKDLEGKLNDKRFARVHKSFIVNLEKIESIQAELIQISGKEIPIGRQQYRWLLGKIKIL